MMMMIMMMRCSSGDDDVKHDEMHDDSNVVHLTKLLGSAYTAKVVLVVS